MKKLIPALCLLLVTAVIVGTSSYAWFSMSGDVYAKGMSVKATADEGIVIRLDSTNLQTYTAGNWATTDEQAATITTAALKSVSTPDCVNWACAKADKYDDACAEQDASEYTTVTADDNNYMAKYTYGIRSSNAQAITGKNLAVKGVTVTKPTSAGTENLDKSIRVAIKIGDEFFIYAPFTDNENLSLVANYASAAAITAKAEPAAGGDVFTAVTTIPANDTDLKVDVYVYYEGEDSNNKSKNVASTIDTLTVDLQFGLVSGS